MEENYSFQDVIGAASWDTAFFTTYALSLSFFEAVPWSGLRAKGCHDVHVLADVDGYRASLSEFGAAHVGRGYDLTPVRVRGGYFFHPKISVVVGKDGARAMVGSGNMTFMGWGGNLEFMDYLDPQFAPAAFADMAGFFASLPEIERLEAAWPDLAKLATACRRAANGAQEGNVRFLHNLVSPLADQLKAFADAQGGATALRVVAPFWGSGTAIVELAGMLNVLDVAVGVCAETGERFPFEEVAASGLEVRAVTGDLLNEELRKLHGKLVIVECREADIVLTGSANGSQAALTKLQNVEAGVLRIIPQSARLGWRNVKWPAPSAIQEEAERSLSKERVISVRFDGSQLTGLLLDEVEAETVWNASLTERRSDREIRFDVPVGADGIFTVRDKGVADFLWQSRNAVALRLSTGSALASGWVTQSPYLEAVRERGAIAESLIRVVGGAADEKDLALILQYFAHSPEFLLSGGSSSSTQDQKPATGSAVMVRPGQLAPIADCDAAKGSPGGLSAGGSAFEQLLRRFRTFLSLETPRSSKDADTDGLDEDGAETKSKKPPATRVGAELERVLAVLEEAAKARKNTEAVREVLLTYIDLVLYVAGQIDDGDIVRATYLSRWRRLIERYSRFENDIDTLEETLGFVVVASGTSAVGDQAAHAALQRRVGGMVSDDYRNALLKMGSSKRALRVMPELDVDGWALRIESILGTRTPWMDALEIWNCVQTGTAARDDNSLLAQAEGPWLVEMIEGTRPRDRLIPVGEKDDISYCPRNRLRLAEIQIGRLSTVRLARTNCCSNILINLKP